MGKISIDITKRIKYFSLDNNIYIFKGYCYKVMEERTNWNTAKRNCENESAEITYISTRSENDFIKGWCIILT